MLRRRGHVTVKVKAEYVAVISFKNEGKKNREEPSLGILWWAFDIENKVCGKERATSS